MQEIQSRPLTPISRIEAVDDPNVNNALFTLYGNLIEPLSNIETMMAIISVAKQTKDECGTAVTYSRAETAAGALLKIPKIFIILTVSIIIFYGTVINWILEKFNPPKILNPILDPPLPMAFLFFAIASVVISFATEFMKASSAVAAKNKSRKESYDKAIKTLAQVEPDLKQQVFQIKDVIRFVPPKYRFSDALRYFVESYTNSRVDNLKEAVNAYDTYHFRGQTLEVQQQLLEQERRNSELLADIRYEQLVIMQQLDSIRDDVWLSSIF